MKNKILPILFFPFCFLPLFFLSANAGEKTLECESVRKLVTKEALKARIFSDGEAFPLKEIAESDEGDENKKNETF